MNPKNPTRVGELVALYLVLTGLYIVLPDSLHPLQVALNGLLLATLALIVWRGLSSLKRD